MCSPLHGFGTCVACRYEFAFVTIKEIATSRNSYNSHSWFFFPYKIKVELFMLIRESLFMPIRVLINAYSCILIYAYSCSLLMLIRESLFMPICDSLFMPICESLLMLIRVLYSSQFVMSSLSIRVKEFSVRLHSPRKEMKMVVPPAGRRFPSSGTPVSHKRDSTFPQAGICGKRER